MDEYHNIVKQKKPGAQKITYWSILFMENTKTGKLTYGIKVKIVVALRDGVRNQRWTQEGFWLLTTILIRRM